MSTLDWSALTHAYGPATDIPVLLMQARTAAAPVTYRDEPWFSLWSALCHQGDVYSASYAALPELVAIAEIRTTDSIAARECLLLAGSIELERALPEGSTTPPDIPPTLKPAYDAALDRGALLASALLRDDSQDTEHKRALLISHAALSGNVEEARRLADPPDEDEE